MIRLDTIARFEPAVGPAVIGRYNLQYSAQFYANPAVPLAEALQLVEALGDELLPLGYTLNLVGEAEEFERTAAAIIVVLACTALNMRSWRQPSSIASR